MNTGITFMLGWKLETGLMKETTASLKASRFHLFLVLCKFHQSMHIVLF